MRLVFTFLTLAITAVASVTSFAAVSTQEIRPSDTGATITASNVPHIVFTEGNTDPQPLLVFLPGTGGVTTQTVKIERAFIDTALAQGYRVVVLSYIDTPAIAQMCNQRVLVEDSNCAEEARQDRTFGTHASPGSSRTDQDTIVGRLTALLQYLSRTDAQGHWEQYLQANQPRWDKIVLSGQSQGGGMAAFIAKRVALAGVIDFSGGWDMQSRDGIASWYNSPGMTSPERLYGTYHVDEKFAKTIAASYDAMHFPSNHQFALDKPIRNPNAKNPGHGEGASNPIYQGIWEQMLRQLRQQ